MYSEKEIINQTEWMNNFYPKLPLKIRELAIFMEYTIDTFPKCPNCNLPVGYNKAYLNSFNKFCSNKCSKAIGSLSIDTKKCLSDYNWLYNKRLVEKLSHKSIADILKCSEYPVIKACKRLNIPLIKLNESDASVKRFLNDKSWLTSEHKDKHRTLDDIGNEIGTSKSTLSIFLEKHGIIANESNSYERLNTSSKECVEVENYIKSIIPENCIKIGDRQILKGREIDILVTNKSIGFEYNGIISHIHYFEKYGVQNSNKTKSYHLDKTILAKENGIKLVHIWSDDWLMNKEVVKGLIAAKLNVFDMTIGARKCEVFRPTISEKVVFLNNNHLQGKDHSSIQYGLKCNNEIVAIMTFCKSRYNKIAKWELSRFAVKRYTKVIGAFSKLLSAFRKEYSGSIISYADRSHSEGDVYFKNGFSLVKTNPPAYKYVKIKESLKRLHRSNFTKNRIAPNDSRCEAEIMFERGYRQIYDCGTLTFLLT